MSKELLFKNSKKGVVKSVDPIITQTENHQPIIEKLMESAAVCRKCPPFQCAQNWDSSIYPVSSVASQNT